MVDEALGQLAKTIADLEGFIERRAMELAAPIVETTHRLMDEHEQAWQWQVNRAEDLLAEMRRQITGLERQVERGPEWLQSAMFSAFMSGRWREITDVMTWQERNAAADAVEKYAKRTKMNPPVDVAELRWWKRPFGASQ